MILTKSNIGPYKSLYSYLTLVQVPGNHVAVTHYFHTHPSARKQSCSIPDPTQFSPFLALLCLYHAEVYLFNYLFVSADDRTLFVKGLADSVDEGKLQAFFSEATEVRLPQKEGYHRGYDIQNCFIEMDVWSATASLGM